MARKQLRATTTRDYIHTLKGKDVAPWRERPVATITKRDILDVMDCIVARHAPVAANHFLAYVRPFFEWCAEREVIDGVPTDRIRAPAKVPRRERALSVDEVREVWEAFGALECERKMRRVTRSILDGRLPAPGGPIGRCPSP